MNRLILAIALLSACGATESTPTAVAVPVAAETVTYACPMHPEVTSTDPDADCSICGMDLTVQEDHDHSGHEH